MPGCAERRRIAGFVNPGRRGAGAGLAEARHVPSACHRLRARAATTASSLPLPSTAAGPSSKSQQPPGGRGCPLLAPHARPGPGGLRGRLPALPSTPHLLRAPGEGAPGPYRCPPSAPGGRWGGWQRTSWRGSTDGSRRLLAAPAASALGARGVGGKGLLISSISISVKGRRPLGARGRNLHLNR